MTAKPDNPSFRVRPPRGDSTYPAGWMTYTNSWLNPQSTELAELAPLVQGLQGIKVEEDRYALSKIRKWLEFADRLLHGGSTRRSGNHRAEK